MATFHFDIVSPERVVFSGEVDQVDVPGSEGDFGVLPGHAPLVSMLRPGILTVIRGGQAQRIIVVGGFAEVNPDGLTVLADLAMPVDEVDHATIAREIKDAEEDVADATTDAIRDKARQKLDQLRAAQSALSS
jgi:F-type H+-transporting ATPase subunit epsilon